MKRAFTSGLGAGLLVALAFTVRADTVVWTGASSTNWFSSANWTNAAGDAVVPSAGDDVIIDGATLQPTLSVAGGAVTIQSLFVGANNAATLTVAHANADAGKLVVSGNVTVGGSGVLTHFANTTGEVHRLNVAVKGDMTIETGGLIDVDLRGYNFNQGPGKGGSNYGASHGGRGGRYNGGRAEVYGSVTVPITMGSGGPQAGSEGGGSVILDVAGQFTLEGTMSANGGPDLASTGGGGAGGSLYVTAGSLSGNGLMRANALNCLGSYNGGGGGGRIATIVTNDTGFGAVQFQAYGAEGRFNSVNRGIEGGGAGTVFLKKLGDTAGLLRVDNNNGLDRANQEAYTDLPAGVWVFDAIHATNAGLPRVAAGAVLDISAGADIVIHTNESRLIIGAGTLAPPADFVISNMIVSFSGTAFHTWTSHVTVAAGGLLTHEAHFSLENVLRNRLDLTVDGRLVVNAGGVIDVSAKGFYAGFGPGPGGQHYGASHGGQNGVYSGIARAPYGSLTNPITLGSGGFSSIGAYARGGGSIRLNVSGALTNNGVITADGQSNGPNSHGGPGAGGSIFLAADSLAGSGIITADAMDAGGIGYSARYNGGGSGGRVAVYLTGSDSFGNVVIHAYGGMGCFNGLADQRYGGAAGTVYLKPAGKDHGQLIIDNNNRMTNAVATTRIATSVTDRVVGDVILAGQGHLTLDSNQFVTCFGSWSNGGRFTAHTDSTVTLAGAVSGDIFGSNRFYHLICEAPGKTVRFEAGSQTFIQPFGRLTLLGASGDLLALTSRVTSAWFLTVEPNAALAVDYVAAAYSDASAGQTIAVPNGRDDGNNLNWNFAGGEVVVWNGSSNTVWSEGANWDGGQIPTLLDVAVIPVVGGGVYPVLDANVEIAGLTNQTGASLSLNGRNLKINGSALFAGALAAAGTETLTLNGDADFQGVSFPSALPRILLSGASAQSFAGDGRSFGVIRVAHTNGVTFSESFDAWEFTCLAANATLTFAAGSTVSVSNLLLIGSAAEPIRLGSSSPGSAWNLLVASREAVRHVQVRDSHADGGKTVRAVDSVDLGNNVSWDFGTWHVWNGAVSAVWTNAVNWTNGVPPGAADSVWIDGHGGFAPILTTTAAVARLTVGLSVPTVLTINTNLTVTGDMLAGPVATLTHSGPAATENSRLLLQIGGEFDLAEGGLIELTSKGFNTQTGPGTTGGNTAGSHGGQGRPAGGDCYGSIAAPTRWGSGGHSSAGGGALQIDAGGTVTIDGIIRADASNGDHYPGSGGSVFIRAGQFRGIGAISANGGRGLLTTFGSGGGGRISVVLTNGVSFDRVTFASFDGRSPGDGAAGTVYLQTMLQTYGDLIVDNGGEVCTSVTTRVSTNVADTVVGDVVIRGGALLAVGAGQSLTVHGSWSNESAAVAESGSTVILAGASDAVVTGTNTFANLTAEGPGKTILFAPSGTNRVNDALTFSRVTLKSASPGMPWFLSLAPGASQQVSRVWVQDGDASDGQTIQAEKSSDGGNNVNWLIRRGDGVLIMVR